MKTTDDYIGRFEEDFYADMNTAFIKNMRSATKEEEQSVQEYIDQISEPTGINLYDLLGLEEPILTELKNPFIQNHFENKACENCSSNPKNGGDGICLCTLGQPTIY